MKHVETASPSEGADAAVQREWQAPTLTELGDVATLTASSPSLPGPDADFGAAS